MTLRETRLLLWLLALAAIVAWGVTAAEEWASAPQAQYEVIR